MESSQDLSDFYSFSVKTLKGETLKLSAFKDQVLLIVNVASKCGFTSQYKELEAMYQKFKSQGFTILGFPCNQFGYQEPGSASEIQTFCEVNYGVTFPLFAKIKVNGKDTDPVYQYLKTAKKGIFGTESIKWNFTKFLVGRDGEVLNRFESRRSPKSFEGEVQVALGIDEGN